MRPILVCLLLGFTSCTVHPKRLMLDPTVRNNLNFLYDNTHVEFAFCAYGEYTRQLVWVRRITLPVIYSSDEGRINYGECSGRGFLGYGHSHPRDNECSYSDVDIGSLLASPPPFGFLMCDKQQFTWYIKADVEKEVAKEVAEKR